MLNIEITNLDKMAQVFKALSNLNRLRIFYRLATCCEPGTVGIIDSLDSHRYVGELGEELNIGKSTVSHHLKELKRVGLIRTERKGQKIACWVDLEMIKQLRFFFSL